MSTNKEDEARIGFESGRSVYEINYPFIYPSAEGVSKEFQQNIGWARYPRTVPDEPSRPPLGGINLAVSAYSATTPTRPSTPPSASPTTSTRRSPPRRAACRRRPSRSTTPRQVQKAYPFADLLRESIDDAAPRPVTPAYNDISLAIQKTFHPPDAVDPDTIVDKLRDRLDKAAEGKIF